MLSYAKSHNVDLIIMSSRGFGGFKKSLLERSQVKYLNIPTARS
ncbi:protein of unknown function [Candidatus Nitrosotalea okcheonensis]|uniref:Uncharacterized protein n=1 Tax=Candidatus Nitrosotalea okcheonensis TaxID=1903276 RepID=A0A2H1FCE2_9ARCH|nr:protein of unknown function [Candidatus Nitrosotalea okcheonensis]